MIVNKLLVGIVGLLLVGSFTLGYWQGVSTTKKQFVGSYENKESFVPDKVSLESSPLLIVAGDSAQLKLPAVTKSNLLVTVSAADEKKLVFKEAFCLPVNEKIYGGCQSFEVFLTSSDILAIKGKSLLGEGGVPITLKEFKQGQTVSIVFKDGTPHLSENIEKIVLLESAVK